MTKLDDIPFFIGFGMASLCIFLMAIEIIKLFLPDNKKNKDPKSLHGH